MADLLTQQMDANALPDDMKAELARMMQVLHYAFRADSVMLIFQGPDTQGVIGTMSLPDAQAMIDIAQARAAKLKGDLN